MKKKDKEKNELVVFIDDRKPYATDPGPWLLSLSLKTNNTEKQITNPSDPYIHVYSKCLKISSVSCLPKRAGQIASTHIRLLMKKQSDQGLTCLLFSEKVFF